MAVPLSAPLDYPFIPEFKADRPFVYLIREKLTPATLQTGAIALVLACAGLAADAADKVDKVELLSTHETVAEFEGIKYPKCMGLTSRCPENCGSSGEYAVFKIVKYLKYEKPGKYGDAKAKEKQLRISDYHKQPVGDPKLNAIIKELNKGDRVLLSWDHNYVTKKYESGTTGSFPERPITKLEKTDKE
jgi:hypothetical protein